MIDTQPDCPMFNGKLTWLSFRFNGKTIHIKPTCKHNFHLIKFVPSYDDFTNMFFFIANLFGVLTKGSSYRIMYLLLANVFLTDDKGWELSSLNKFYRPKLG